MGHHQITQESWCWTLIRHSLVGLWNVWSGLSKTVSGRQRALQCCSRDLAVERWRRDSCCPQSVLIISQAPAFKVSPLPCKEKYKCKMQEKFLVSHYISWFERHGNWTISWCDPNSSLINNQPQAGWKLPEIHKKGGKKKVALPQRSHPIYWSSEELSDENKGWWVNVTRTNQNDY